jgi:hypothetical protein
MFDVAAVGRQPLDNFDHLPGQLETPFSDLEPFVIHLALAADDVEKPAGNAGREDGAVLLDPFFEAALPAAFA